MLLREHFFIKFCVLSEKWNFFQIAEDEVLPQLALSILSFRMALHFDSHDHYITYNFGSALYQIRSRVNHLMQQVHIFPIL